MALPPYPLPREPRETAVLVGNGGATYGPFAFKIFDVEDVAVFLCPAGERVFAQADVTVAKTTGAELDTFSVTFAENITADDAFVVQGRRLHERQVAVTRGGALSAQELEKELAKQGAVAGELRRDVDRSVRLAPGVEGNGQLPALAAGETMMWDGELGQFVPGPDAADIVAAAPAAATAVAARDVAVAASEDSVSAKDAAEAAAAIALAAVPTAVRDTVAAIAALDTEAYANARLTQAGREGDFVLVDHDDHSATIAADTQKGVFIRSTFDTDKAWMRIYSGPLNALWFMDVVPPSTAGWDALDGGDKRGTDRLALGDQVYTGLAALWTMMKLLKQSAYFPKGRYEVSGQRNLPFRQEIVTDLLDCGGISILADGPDTVFATNSADGADVFQLNGMDNFGIRGFPTITAVLGDGDLYGSNGVSITNGFDRLYIEVECVHLPSLDKTSYGDGGKGVTFQPYTTTEKCGSAVVKVIARGCLYAFGADLILETVAANSMAIDAEVFAEDCYSACTIACPAAVEAIPGGLSMGIKVRGYAINCQRDLDLNRVHGVDVELDVLTTKSKSARTKSPEGVDWITSDTVVEAVRVGYAHFSSIAVRGNKGACDYKARIGGTSAGSSGLTGATKASELLADLGGTPAIAPVAALDSGGDVASDSTIAITSRTASSVPDEFYTTSRNNVVMIGPSGRLVGPVFASRVGLAMASDGKIETGSIELTGGVTVLRGKNASGSGVAVAGLADHGGAVKFAVRNGEGQGFVTDSVSSTGALGAYYGKIILRIGETSYALPVYQFS
ncbi:MAG: hypothetical protein KF723_23180 [Rhizobiaceae bacterium]|nr:hypothetical protein [Rhizobiaceae bacterium]